jgi:hypothetical protein
VHPGSRGRLRSESNAQQMCEALDHHIVHPTPLVREALRPPVPEVNLTRPSAASFPATPRVGCCKRATGQRQEPSGRPPLELGHLESRPRRNRSRAEKPHARGPTSNLRPGGPRRPAQAERRCGTRVRVPAVGCTTDDNHSREWASPFSRFAARGRTKLAGRKRYREDDRRSGDPRATQQRLPWGLDGTASRCLVPNWRKSTPSPRFPVG